MNTKSFWTPVLLGAVCAATACGPARGKDDDKVDCIGTACPTDGGGAGEDAGVDAGQLFSLQELRANLPPPNSPIRVKLDGLMVHTISSRFRGSSGDHEAQFWAMQPGSNPPVGIWIEKIFFDTPSTYEPKPGDIINVDGFFSTENPFTDRSGYRYILAREKEVVSNVVGNGIPLTIEVVSTGNAVPPPVTVAAGFGNADAGRWRPNPEYSGVRVFIPGPLELTDPQPLAMRRVSYTAADLSGSDAGFFGFEVTGGILVNNYKTFGNSPTDGGAARCDYRKAEVDGVGQATFPNGISGIWDTYTHAPCADGGTRGYDKDLFPTGGFECFKERGRVPFTGAFDGGLKDAFGQNFYTYALYPQNCHEDLDGGVN